MSVETASHRPHIKVVRQVAGRDEIAIVLLAVQVEYLVPLEGVL